jgi:tetratricopeptide (TPR) repeat protein
VEGDELTSPSQAEAVLHELEQLRLRETQRTKLVLTLSFVGWVVVAGTLIWTIAKLDNQRRTLQSENKRLEQNNVVLEAKRRTLDLQIGTYRTDMVVLEAQRHQLNDSIAALQQQISSLEHQRLSTASLLTEYDAALKANPNNAVLRNLRGYTLYRRGYYKEALRDLRHATVQSPDYIWGHYNLALVLWANRDRRGAVAEVASVLAIDPNFVTTIRNDKQFAPFFSETEFRRLVGASAG